MPIYEYRCTACGGRHDALQKVGEPPLTDCPHCGTAALAKALTAAGFQLKGSGWYATDFKGRAPGTKDEQPAGSPATEAPACAGSAAPCAAASCAVAASMADASG